MQNMHMSEPMTCRSLIDWLKTQKRVIAYWRDSIADTKAQDLELVESLSAHHQWLSSELDRLRARNENHSSHTTSTNKKEYS